MIEVLTPLAGGIIIGIAAILMMLTLGRITGISGIFFGLLPDRASGEDRGWRWCFVAGLAIAPLLMITLTGFEAPAPPAGGMSLAIIAGLIVGFGTTLGSGCTSGHGVCGLARLSPRSLAATAIFIAIGVVTATVARLL